MRPNNAKADQELEPGCGQHPQARQPEHRLALRPEGPVPRLVRPEPSRSWRTWRSSAVRGFDVSPSFATWSSKPAEARD